MTKGKGRLRSLLWALLAGALVFSLALSGILFSGDAILSDLLHRIPASPDPNIRIIAIDERTLAEYGEIGTWSRTVPARLVDALCADERGPAAIVFDILFVSPRDGEGDAAFAAACEKAGCVVSAANLVWRDKVTVTGQGLAVDSAVSMVETPYPGLAEGSDWGFANTYLDRDGFVRRARATAQGPDGETLPSLTAAAVRLYEARTGRTVTLPEGLFPFAYTGGSGSYEVISLCDVLSGRVDARVFRDGIVLVGAYAPGMQDNFSVPIQRGQQMYGVEIHANILDAILSGRTGRTVQPWLYALVSGVLTAGFFLLTENKKLRTTAILAAAALAVCLGGCHLLYRLGWEVRVLEPVLGVAGVTLARVVGGYLTELLHKRRILSAFKKYVAPQVVDEVAAKGDFSIKLGGERRNIAVLFVDIRGFTTMSEGLQPEEVVAILNEYLALTTQAILKNGGTLDKYIGDATMAVFNAPFSLDDYIYRAVCTARDIAAGSGELEARLQAKFGKSVSFGIGVNCGDAVVGNIGCDFRMDYTAIGDTVNTAARLEANAKRGQILISREVYEAVKDRVKVTDIGVIPLKGKSNEVFVYQLDEVTDA